MTDEELITLVQAHEKFAKSLNGETWDLLGNEDRTRKEDELMVLAASSSLYHWLQIGTAVHAQRGEWLLARVFTILEKPEPAMDHALRCREFTAANPREMKDFDLAYAEEVIARVYALMKNGTQAKEYHARAVELGREIADSDDKGIFDGDLKAESWFGMV